ncbi:ubiquitin-related modifier 1 [Myxozyma melibiosi]|uniref:Ubiquitin-related modifier 1 n=1 Tax=Myxozyma melibiosi TaxID=54550 RepID=A0ABR1F1Z2_9ASCO
MAVPFTVEFSGGLEILFGGERVMKLSLASPRDDDNLTIADLVKHLCDEKMTDSRRDMFVIEGYNVRPGILVLINDADWELEGEADFRAVG